MVRGKRIVTAIYLTTKLDKLMLHSAAFEVEPVNQNRIHVCIERKVLLPVSTTEECLYMEAEPALEQIQLKQN